MYSPALYLTFRPKFIVEVEVVPEKSMHSWWLDGAGRLKVHHHEPESFATNDFLIKDMAAKLHINHSKIALVHGMESRIKRFKVGGNVTLEQLIEALEAKKIV